MFHGLDDPVVAPKQSEIMFEAIKAEHGDVRLWEYAGWQHNVWEKAYASRICHAGCWRIVSRVRL